MKADLKLLRTLVTAAAPILLFLLFFMPEVLNPTRVSWLMDCDWGQHFLGWHAYRQAPMAWPFNHEDLLAHPTGLSLIYTDSNPLLALPSRLVSPLLPKHFQYIGLWFLACVVVHYYIAYRLVVRHAPGPWAAVAGATLLTLLPTLYNRIAHDTLCAHWLLLWALFVFFEIRDERKKRIGYGAVMGVAGLVHPYLLFMILAIWGADQLRWFIPMLKAKDFKQAAITTLKSALSLLPPFITLLISGAFSGQSAGAEGFGDFGMPLDAFFNPGRKDFSLAFLNGPQVPAMEFEGFQYLGAGILFLIGAAIYLNRKSPSTEVRDVLARARPLLWPFVGLLMLALSNHVFLYTLKLVDLPLPASLLRVLDVVRASGRLAWPLAYTAVWLSLVCVYRAAPRKLGLILGVALLIQIADMGPYASHIRQLTARATKAETYQIARSPLWDKVIAQADMVSFQPAVPVSHPQPFYEIILHALDLKVPINMMYVSRENSTQTALQAADYYKFLEGRPDPNHLYVMLGKAVPAGLESRVRQIDGIWVIAPQKAAAMLTDIPVMPAFQLGAVYNFGVELPATAWADRQWGLPRTSNLTSCAPQSSLTMPYTPGPGDGLQLTLNLSAERDGQPVQIAVDGTILSDERVSKQARDVIVQIPNAALKPGPVRITVLNPMASAQNQPCDVKLYSLRMDRLKT